jgi:hypothetical protein
MVAAMWSHCVGLCAMHDSASVIYNNLCVCNDGSCSDMDSFNCMVIRRIPGPTPSCPIFHS